MNVVLSEISFNTTEVTVTGVSQNNNVKSTGMGIISIQNRTLKNIPNMLGESDPLKSIALSPGVQSAGDANAGLNVRGGTPDQNLILLDDAIIFNPNHLFGFYSVFNADAVENINLIKAGMPANYGGRIASVVDVKMKQGDMENFSTEGSIGIVAAHLTVQGPIKKNKHSFIISFRRTYIDDIARFLFSKYVTLLRQGSGYYFYDFNFKATFTLSPKDKIYFTGFYGADRFIFNAQNEFSNKIDWDNMTAVFKWNHLFNTSFSSNFHASISNYTYSFNASQSGYDLSMFSGVRNICLKQEFNIDMKNESSLKIGAEILFNDFAPNKINLTSDNTNFDMGTPMLLHTRESNLYADYQWNVSEKLRIDAGLRYSFFSFLGPFTRYVLNQNQVITDSTVYAKNQNIQTYQNLEPRISMRYLIDKTTSIKAAFTENAQYNNLVSVSSVSLPTDVWVPSSTNIKPQTGQQYGLGVFKNFKDNDYETSCEIYYKRMQNQLEYKDGLIELYDRSNFDDRFYVGTSQSYGAEWYVKKNAGKFTGWLSYTLSHTTRTFPDIDNGTPFPAKYDRLHDLSVVGFYKLSDKWTITGTFVYATGNALTLPVARYVIQGNIINVYSSQNGFRMPPYHRLDLGANYIIKRNAKYESILNLSIYNVYNHLNPYYIYFDVSGNINNYKLDVTAKQVSLFPVIPSVSWTFKFL